MSDDKKNVGKSDRDRININEEYEVTYWSKKFNVTAEELKNEVKKSGPMVKDVEKAFKK